MELQIEMDTYLLHRIPVNNKTFQEPFLGVQDDYSLTRLTCTEQSNVIYLEVLDAVADCIVTIMTLLHNSNKNGKGLEWVILEGNAKIYEILKCLTFEYGEDLSWLIKYRGDFHMLLNILSKSS